MRLFLAALITGLSVLGARAETYADWIQSAPNDSAIVFKNWLPADMTSVRFHDSDYYEFSAPIGNLFGYLDLSGVAPARFPIQVRFYYRRIEPEAVNHISNSLAEHTRDWSAPIDLLASDAPVGDLIGVRQIEAGSNSEMVPVWDFRPPEVMMERGNLDNLHSVAVEIVGHDGEVLSRKRLVEAVEQRGTSNIAMVRMNTGENDLLAKLGTLTQVDQLPAFARAYQGVKVLWLDKESLDDPKFTDDYWRDVFFYGTTVVGQAEQVKALAQRLGVAPNQRILLGGLWAVDAPGLDLAAQLKPPSPGQQQSFNEDKPDNPFRVPLNLGRGKVNELRNFSIWFLVVFTVVETAVIIGSLYLLRGYQRVWRWVIVPASAILYAVAGFGLVRLVADFQPEAQMEQTVYSVVGWPESLVHVKIERLAFDNGGAVFQAPGRADFDTSDAKACPFRYEQKPEGTTCSWRQRYGTFTHAQVEYRIKSDSPCQITADRKIVATRPLSAAWVWDGNDWRDVGPLKPGQPVAIDLAPIALKRSSISPDSELMNGFYTFAQETQYPEIFQQLCSRAYMDSLVHTNTGVLMAIDDQPAPGELMDATSTNIHRKTILVHQFSYAAPSP
jgi:hypothetical protein